MLENPKLNFNIGSITAKAESTRKIPQKLFPNHYCLDGHIIIVDWDFTLFEQCET